MKNKIKVIRAEQDLTQQQLADKAGICRATLNRIERGIITPNGETITKIVRALERPANEIFLDLDFVCEQHSRAE